MPFDDFLSCVCEDWQHELLYKEPRVKRAFDLVLTPSGVKRKVMVCHTSIHQCLQCGTEFVPDQHQHLDKHFHGLKSWAMFQHVAYRISLETLLKMTEEFFGIHLFQTEMLMFKSFMAAYYKTTYHNLLKKILAGHLLHVDETEVKLQQGKGYVWVFTNLNRSTQHWDMPRSVRCAHDCLAPPLFVRIAHATQRWTAIRMYESLVGCFRRRVTVAPRRKTSQRSPRAVYPVPVVLTPQSSEFFRTNLQPLS